jgi:hypothetical protein
MNTFVRTNRLIGDSPKEQAGFKEIEKNNIGYRPALTKDDGFVGERMTAEAYQRVLRYSELRKTNLQGGLS